MTELRRMHEQLGQLRAVTLSDGGTSGGEMASGNDGLAISFPSGLRSFWGEIVTNLGAGAYTVNQVEDIGGATLAPDVQTSSDWFQGVQVGEMDSNPTVAPGTPVRCFPSMNPALPWSFLAPAAGTSPASGTATLASPYACTSGAAATGLSVVLPVAGTYLITFQVEAQLVVSSSLGSYISVTGFDLTNSTGIGGARYVAEAQQATGTINASMALVCALYTPATVPATIELKASYTNQPGTGTVSGTINAFDTWANFVQVP
jgi:hypothetical protein